MSFPDEPGQVTRLSAVLWEHYFQGEMGNIQGLELATSLDWGCMLTNAGVFPNWRTLGWWWRKSYFPEISQDLRNHMIS